MTYSKDISDIPLKPPVETFVDDPTSLDECSIDELMFDLTHGIKNINKLHVFHAILVLSQTLQDIIKLQEHPALFEQFRATQLAKFGIELSAVRTPEIDQIGLMKYGNSHSSTPPSSPPLKFTKLNEPSSFSLAENDFGQYAEATPESQDEEGEEDAPFVPIEQLVKSTSLDEVETPIDSSCPERFRKEFFSCQKNKRLVQNSHLLKSFNLVKLPPLLITDFLLRIKTYSSSISVSSYIHSALLMFKLSVLLDIVPLTQMNAYRFILASIRCSTKNLEDVYQKQKSFATVGGVSPKDLFKVEVGFLYLCNFKLIIGESLLNQFLTSLFLDLRNFCIEHFEIDKKPKD
ncbi:uncharacterized protein CANTADRAFT_26545 [Suhomyces tanzawaensis NRRL Y-17324]|uniref:Cyclin-domain-containing protein n=1 Tax=Suhomyces tanzawaensis NRRL Y-17324 TaxID=984487 RepID=A0A1E4SG64_9ASCO|nr:uncharacterized protein CANTADRAFT_26545 [Suhomyces tanzawaensis NRRL Y-17324]ODV78455.1 hypothetical protein CANTADRAFT_26545 [Suhomyces tanzawaensis NRRL Y-17324]